MSTEIGATAVKQGEVMTLVNTIDSAINDIYGLSTEILDKLQPVLPPPLPETAPANPVECPDRPLVRDLMAIIDRLKSYNNGLIQLRDTLNI